MKFTRPSWVVHRDSSAPAGSSTASKALTIFSLHVHPDDSRIATGGLDAKVRIWSTAPILSEEVEAKGIIPKSLATLGMHTGPVLCVRWAHSGRWLASGSDDSVILIWDLDPKGAGKIWGSDEVNIEGWKALKRLPGHESDVTGLSWSPGDRYLASVGLDSIVMIWDGYSLERLQKLDQHAGFVKGVCWDPAGEFLATCSDDKTVKVWRRIPPPPTHPMHPSTFELEATIAKPFSDSPGNTFFRRLSWSPDGAHITVANATNGRGLVYVAAVISRRTWDSEISLVGHGHTVQAVAFNPHIFLRDPSLPPQTSNICSVVALGGDDCSVSVWQTKSARPLVVARDAFGRGVLDLSWSSDGLSLYGCSADGTMAVFQFTSDELDGMTPSSVQEAYLRKFGTFLDGPIPVPSQNPVDMQVPSQALPEPMSEPEEKVTTLVARRGKSKRRVGLESVPSAVVPSMSNSIPIDNVNGAPTTTIGFEYDFLSRGSGSRPPVSQMNPPMTPFYDHSSSQFARSQSQPSLAFRSQANSRSQAPFSMGPPQTNPFQSSFQEGNDMFGFDIGGAGHIDSPMVDAFHAEDSLPGRNRAPPTKSRTLGGDRARQDAPIVRVIGSGARDMNPGDSEDVVGSDVLVAPDVKNYVVAKAEGSSEDMLEARNDEGHRPTEVTYLSGKQGSTQWLDYLPSPVLLLTLSIINGSAGQGFGAVACANSTIGIYTLTGRREIPTIMLGDKCAFLESAKMYLMAITVRGAMHVWNIKNGSAHHPPVSLSPLLRSQSPNTRILSVSLRPNGAPVIHLSSGTIYAYDKSLGNWVIVSDSWWSTGSDAWNHRSRSSSFASPGLGVVSQIEAAVSESSMVPSTDDVERPVWWNTALTLGHLESRLHGCRLLESAAEYKQALLVYAKKIADEGFRAKGEELVKELCGPVYWQPGREDKWCSTVCGMQKRDLLRDVLTIFARSKTLPKLAQDWQELLKKAASGE